MKNFVIDGSKVPAVIPVGHWRADMSVYYKGELLYMMQIFFKMLGISLFRN